MAGQAVQARPERVSNLYVDALKWPIVGWIIVEVVLLLATFISADVSDMITPASQAVLFLLFGLWAGYQIVEYGGNMGHAVLAGLVLGIVAGLLTMIAFGLINDIMGGFAGAFPFGLFALSLNLAGGIIGGGFSHGRRLLIK